MVCSVTYKNGKIWKSGGQKRHAKPKKKTYLHFLKKQEMRDTSGPSVDLSAVH